MQVFTINTSIHVQVFTVTSTLLTYVLYAKKTVL